MTRRTAAIYALLWSLIATSVAAGIVAGGLILGALSPVSASRPALASPSPSGELTSSSLPGRTRMPEPVSAAAIVPGAVAAISSPSVGSHPARDARPVGGQSPATGETPATGNGAASMTAALSGVASWYADPRRFGLYAAHPAYRWGMAPYPLIVCGPSGCATVPVVDAGPDPASQRASRIVDLSPSAFRAICGPLSLGLCRVTVTGGTP